MKRKDIKIKSENNLEVQHTVHIIKLSAHNES
jgi:hypothetical protein